MGKLFAFAVSVIAGIAAVASTGACWVAWIDEPVMPESLIR